MVFLFQDLHPTTLTQTRDSYAIKITDHLLQNYNTDKFCYFDYGKTENEKLYGTAEPPFYKFTGVKIPNLLVRGPSDLLATSKVN